MAEEAALYGARNDSSPASQATARKVVSAARNGDVGDHRLRLLERLIDAEVRDLQTERIHPHELVRHVVAQRRSRPAR